jgi:hypothetical protein
MGFLDYAWIVSFQKDNKKVRILQDSTLDQPTLEPDSYGFTLKLPTVQFLEKGQIAYLGQKFPSDTAGKSKVGRLFRAAVLHLTTHTSTRTFKQGIQKDSLTSPMQMRWSFKKSNPPKESLLPQQRL